MNKHGMIFIGLDTHKEFLVVAYCEEPRGATPVNYELKECQESTRSGLTKEVIPTFQ